MSPDDLSNVKLAPNYRLPWEELLQRLTKLLVVERISVETSSVFFKELRSRKACTRSKVLRLHTSNWPQFAASISKEKFTAKGRANFGPGDSLGKDIEDELDLVALAEQSNHQADINCISC